MVSFGKNFAPLALRGYQRSWLVADIVAGTTLSAVAIPEVMGYTSIAQTPVITGLYTIIFPTLLFALLGSSRLLVVGADSATAAILAAGLAGLGISGLSPNTSEWVAWTSLVALVCGGLLILARLLKLGFLGDCLSASVLIGFLQGGFPPIGLPEGITLTDIPAVIGVALSCFFLIIAQSAATSRSFAMKHDQRVDINRDLVGLAGANLAAGLTGTFVVNGSPTKTQMVDGAGSRSQLAQVTTGVIVLIVLLFLTAPIQYLPFSVLASVVFLIGLELVDYRGMAKVFRVRLE